MKLAAIDISGFRGFARRERLDVDADAVIVSGANGRGKTSVFDAILWALSGGIPRLREDSRNVVSLYSESGEATVLLKFKQENGLPYQIRRSQRSGSEEQRLQVESDAGAIHGEAAEAKLIHDFWPNALVAEEGGTAPARLVTRGIYLQQDLVRQFVEADDENERFEVVSDLIGAGRVYELQKQLEASRKAWSTVTNTRKREEEQLRTRVQGLRTELASLSGAPVGVEQDARALWHSWWSRALSLGVTVRYPEDPSTVEASQSLDSGIKQAQTLRRAAERKLDIASDLRRQIAARGAQAAPTASRRLVEAQDAARQRTAEARAALQAAEVTAAAQRRGLVQQREEREELGALARLAQRHLGDRCPVCTQTFDREVVQRHLEALIRASGSVGSEQPVGDEVQQAARYLEHCEREEAMALAAVREVERAEEDARGWIQERGRRLAELDIVDGDEAVAEVERVVERLSGLTRELAEVEGGGEQLGLTLARAGEEARRVEVQRQIESLEQQSSAMQRALQRRNQTSRLVESIIDGLRETAAQVVRAKLDAVEPILRRVYARVDPHPAFRDTKLSAWLSHGRGRLSMRLYDTIADVSAEPLRVLSSSQMNALAVAMFLSFNLAMVMLPLRIAILDDPLQSLDDVNLLGLSDLLRRVKTRRQLFVSTHDARFAELLQRKLRPADALQRTRIIELQGWSRSGPSVYQADVALDRRAVRIVA